MARLAGSLFILFAIALAGGFVLVALASGITTLATLVVAASVGILLALPVSCLVARYLMVH